jgi:hypothetical protein
VPEILKILLSAFIIFAISEISKRSSLFGSLVASLPLVSVLAMIWLYHDTGDVARIANFSQNVFWMVLPSLTLFLLLPQLLMRWKLGFPLSLAIGCMATALAYAVMLLVLRRFGISL